ncbi:MAG: GAF domain-containing protein [Flavobacteriaceae bacterium]
MGSRHAWTFLWFFLPLWLVYGQKFQYVTYEGENVPFGKVNRVIEDSRSYMWLATDRGLFRFDGTVFEDFNTSLSSKYIKSLVAFDENNILFSNDTGVYRLNYEDKEVVISPYVEVDESISDLDYPEDILVDSRGWLWISQRDGQVFLFDDKRKFVQRFSLFTKTDAAPILFSRDKYHRIWAFSPGEGLFLFNVDSGKFEQKPGFKNFNCFHIIEDRILLAGERVIQLQIDSDGKTLRTDYLTAAGHSFTYLTVDKTGMIFLASEEGLFTLLSDRPHELSQVYGSNDPHRIETLPFKEINQIYFSSDQVRIGGKIWVSTPEGLALLYSGFFRSVSGMAMDNTVAIGTTIRNEILVSQGNIFRIRNIGGEDIFDEFDTGEIRVTAITSNGPYIWLGTSEGRVIRARDGIRNQFDISDRGGGIFYMFEDSAGKIWFCQAPDEKPIVGVGQLNRRGEYKDYSNNKGLSSRVLVLDEGGKSELYAAGIGLESYLYKYDRDADRFENKSLPFPFKVSRNFEVHDIAVDARGVVWMATTDGLLQYDTERIHRIDLGRHTYGEIRSVCSLPDGSIWMATATNGMIHLDAAGNFVLFDEKSGTPSRIASYRAMVLDNANRLWAGTAEGVVYSVMPFPAPLSTKNPSLERFSVNAREQSLEKSLEMSIEDIADFYFTSISYPGDENKIQYKYYKSNLPEDEIEDIHWLEGEIDSRVRIQPLFAGFYILAVRAQKPGGSSWSIPATIDFKVVKPWYATWWGIITLLLLAGLVFGYILRFFGKIKTAELRSLLSSKEKELSAKEEQLISQGDAIRNQEAALKSAGVSIYLLFRLLRQIPPRAKWIRVLPVLSKLVELPTGMDAFELAFLKKNTVHHLGFQRGLSGIQKRQEDFNEKENLCSYVLHNKRAVLIRDSDKESGQYIGLKDNRGYRSRIYIPFEQFKGAEAVLCVYGEGVDRFSKQDLTILQILATFLSANVTDQLK